eukprot:881920-Amphidinium_carterae.1
MWRRLGYENESRIAHGVELVAQDSQPSIVGLIDTLETSTAAEDTGNHTTLVDLAWLMSKGVHAGQSPLSSEQPLPRLLHVPEWKVQEKVGELVSVSCHFVVFKVRP